MICSILIWILRTNNMFLKWEGGVGRRRLEFVDFAILVNFKFLFDWLSFELSIFWDSNWQLVKLQLTCEDNAFLWFYIGSSKEIIFFFIIHSLNLRKKENLCFDNILFVNYSIVISPVWPSHVFSKWKGRGGSVYFEQSLYEEKPDFKKHDLA